MVMLKYAWHFSGHHALMDDKHIMPTKRPGTPQQTRTTCSSMHDAPVGTTHNHPLVYDVH